MCCLNAVELAAVTNRNQLLQKQYPLSPIKMSEIPGSRAWESIREQKAMWQPVRLCVGDVAGRHDDNIAGSADGDSALAFGNINTNSVHNRYSFEFLTGCKGY